MPKSPAVLSMDTKPLQRANNRLGADSRKLSPKAKNTNRSPSQRNKSPSGRHQVVDQSVPGILVAVRVRPFLPWEKGSQDVAKVSSSGMGFSLLDEEEGTERSFEIDIAFDSRPKANLCATQEVVFERLGLELTKEALERFNVCVIACGQTGSGKTHTLQGKLSTLDASDGKEAGLLPRMLREIFSMHQQTKALTSSMRIQYSVSYYEICNDKIFDLLAPSRIIKGEDGFRCPDVNFHPKFGAVVSDLTECLVDSADGALGLLRFGNRARSAGSCTLSERSSQTHTVFALRFGIGLSRERQGSAVTFVDLADCENSTVGTTDVLKDMRSVNQSLSHLSTCVANLVGRRGGEPRWPEFRKSKVTALLAHSLQGNSKTALVATISPSAMCYNESLHTVGFAELVGKIRTKLPNNGRSPENLAKELRLEVQKLHQDLAEPKCVGKQFLQDNLQEAENMLQYCRRPWADVERESTYLTQLRSTMAASFGLAAGLKQSETIGPGLPCLVNLSDDPALQACCVYALRPGLTLRVGGDTLWSNVLLEGLGILPRMCLLVAVDTERVGPKDAAGPVASVHVQNPSEAWVPQVQRSASGNSASGNKRGKERVVSLADMQAGDSVWPRVLVNGQRVQRVQDLWHNDRIIFGYSQAFRLIQPGREEGIAGVSLELKPALLQVQDEQSEQFQRMQPFLESNSVQNCLNFVDLLHQVCSLVDEANLITRQVRPSDNLLFQLQAQPLLLDSEHDVPQLAVCMLHKPQPTAHLKCNLQNVMDILYGKNGKQHGATGFSEINTKSIGLVLGHQLHPLKEEVGDDSQEGASLLSVWPVEKFLHRLWRMRDHYNAGAQSLDFAAVRQELLERPFEDPWNDVGVFEIQHLIDPQRMSFPSADTRGSLRSSAAAVPSTPVSNGAAAAVTSGVKPTYSSTSLHEGDAVSIKVTEEHVVHRLQQELDKARAREQEQDKEIVELRRKCESQALAVHAFTSTPQSPPHGGPGFSTPVPSTPTRQLSPGPQRTAQVIAVGASHSAAQARSVSPAASVTSNSSGVAGMSSVYPEVVQAEVLGGPDSGRVSLGSSTVGGDLSHLSHAPPVPEYAVKRIASPQHQQQPRPLDGRQQQYLGLHPSTLKRWLTPPPGRAIAQTPTPTKAEVARWCVPLSPMSRPMTQSPPRQSLTPTGGQNHRR